MINFYKEQLDQLKQQGQYRTLPDIKHEGKFIWRNERKMLNLSSNDYLSLASNAGIKEEFLASRNWQQAEFGSSSSRLLTGNFPIYAALEKLMAAQFQREACLLFNSGYHANIGILPALSDKQTLILADKLVHASLIDGILLSSGTYQRFRHNDYEHLAQLLEKNHGAYERIIIVTESVFSMDGDTVDLAKLVELKQRYTNVMLYVDEAHAIGVFGESGLGIAEHCGCIAQIDFLVGTFGKAIASTGAYLLCSQIIKEYLINKMRPLIFSTALSPLIVEWTYFVMQKITNFKKEREHLQKISEQLRQAVQEITNQPMPSSTHIIPIILGDNQSTLELANQLQESGYYCLPIRPPTVPAGGSRIRFSLTADINTDEITQLIKKLKK